MGNHAVRTARAPTPEASATPGGAHGHSEDDPPSHHDHDEAPPASSLLAHRQHGNHHHHHHSSRLSSIRSMDSVSSSFRSGVSHEGSASGGSGSRTPSVKMDSLHSNLMRTYRKRDPMSIYEVVKLLGDGSMGSVSKVRKRESAMGGSARPDYVLKSHGCWFQFCFKLRSFCPPSLSMGSGGHHYDKFLSLEQGDVIVVNQNQSDDFGTTLTVSGRSDDFTKSLRGGTMSGISSSIRMSRQSAATSSIRSLQSLTQPQQQSSTSTSSSSPPGKLVPKQQQQPSPSTLLPPVSTKQRSGAAVASAHSSRSRKSTASSSSGTVPLLKKMSSRVTYGHKKDHHYALKSIHLDRCQSPEFQQELRNEVEILRHLDHPNIGRILETFDYQDRLFLVLELCSGGDLYTRDPYTEEAAAVIVNNLLSAVAYLHSKGIIHRDLKFENCLFENREPNAQVKIIDFGLSQKFAANEHLHDTVGTVYTMSPELLAGDYDAKADIWSIGVMAFMLLSSSMPFYGKERIHVIKKIIKGHVHFTGRRWRYVSNDARNFVKDLMRVDPTKRPSAEMALNMDWMSHVAAAQIRPDDLTMDDIQASIYAFSEYSTLKKLGLMVVAYKSTSEEIGNLRQVFTRFDQIHDGEITLDEFKAALVEEYAYSDEECERMFNGIDVDGSGLVHYSEFLAATIEAFGSLDEERLAEAFDRIDSDDTGYITVQNLADFLGHDVPREYLNRIIDEADILHDKRISYSEFLALWNDESDEQMMLAKQHVKMKRASRQASMASSVSSTGSLSDSERGMSNSTASRSSSGGGTTEDGCTGSMLYNHQKMQSVRGDWV